MSIAEVEDEIRDKGQWILIANGKIVDTTIVLYRSEFAILLLDEENGDAYGDLDTRIYPFVNCSLRKSRNAASSTCVIGYICSH